MRLETEALWVDQRDDRERCATVRQVYTADTSVVLYQDAEEVLVSDLLGMASGLDASHHEAILWRDFLHHALLLLLTE